MVLSADDVRVIPGTQLPCAVTAQLLSTLPPEVGFIGDLNLLARTTTAFFSSSQCSGAAVLRAFERMTQLRDAGEVVIGGFHSPMEQDCLSILLRGRQPIVVVFARALANLHLPPELVPAYTDDRLLLLSPFEPQHRRVTAALAAKRNRFIAAVASNVLVASAAPGSKTAALVIELGACDKPVTVLA